MKGTGKPSAPSTPSKGASHPAKPGQNNPGKAGQCPPAGGKGKGK